MLDRPSTNDALLTAGVDVGSSAVKVAVLRNRPDGAVLLGSRSERIYRRDAAQVAEGALEEVLGDIGLRRDQLAYIATTGAGSALDWRTGHFFGMTAHARGGLFLDGEARCVLDLGALHTRAVVIDPRARVLNHRMTNPCASGAGQFLENISRYLGVAVEEISEIALQADRPESCAMVCAVLAETDVINLISAGVSLPNVLHGLLRAMAQRYAQLLIAVGAQGAVLATGGLAGNSGLVRALQEAVRESGLAVEIRSHHLSALAGALGAALWGDYRARRR